MTAFIHPSIYTTTYRYPVAQLGFAIAKDPSHQSMSPHNHTTAKDPQLKQSTIRGKFPIVKPNTYETLLPPSPNNYANHGEVLADISSVRPHFFRSLRTNTLLSSTINLMNPHALSLTPVKSGAGLHGMTHRLLKPQILR